MANDGTIMLLAAGLGVAVLGGIVVLLSGKKEGPVSAVLMYLRATILTLAASIASFCHSSF